MTGTRLARLLAACVLLVSAAASTRHGLPAPAGSASEAPPAPPPNLILVSIDTLRADHLGAYGYHRDTSPSFDGLARRGVTFAQAVAQAPNTPSSHLSLLTSLYFSAHRFSWRDARIPSGLTMLADLLRASGFATWGFVDGGFLKRDLGFAQGFDHYEDDQVHVAKIWRRVERWLDTRRADRFFLFVHCYDVHSPYRKPPPFDRLYEPEPYRGTFEPDDQSLVAASMDPSHLTPGDLAHTIALYDGAIRYTDGYLHRLLAGLARRGLLDRSVVVVTSDHGEEFLEHGSMLHWQSYFTPNYHVPLVFLIPGRPPRRVEGPVELVDVLPTVLELLGLPPHPAAMGRSLVPLIDGTEPSSRAVAYAEPFQLDSPWRVAVSDRRQLLYNQTTGVKRLYDVWSDPLARDNLAAREPAVVAELLDVIRRRQAQIAQWTPPAQAGGVVSATTRRELEAMGYVLPRPPGP